MIKFIRLLIALLVIGVIFAGWRHMAIGQAVLKERLPAPTLDEPTSIKHSETAVFAGGCFWGVQTVFQQVKGVTATTAGYSGGTANTANYTDVSSESTDHAESVKVVFDPQKISYGTLLRIFFSVVHDPTEVNRQGNDVGKSYRSVIFFTSPEQQHIAQAYVKQLDAAHSFPRPIVTEITPLKAFYDGEEYHLTQTPPPPQTTPPPPPPGAARRTPRFRLRLGRITPKKPVNSTEGATRHSGETPVFRNPSHIDAFSTAMHRQWRENTANSPESRSPSWQPSHTSSPTAVSPPPSRPNVPSLAP